MLPPDKQKDIGNPVKTRKKTRKAILDISDEWEQKTPDFSSEY
ncbi:MAG: hypothetical protein ACFFD4_28225 [Candidatus Odinarchaeota archaeon]